MTAERSSPRRLAAHAAGLAVLLVVVALALGTRSSFITDEAFVVIQVRHLEETGAWTLPHPLPEVDPTGAAFPLHGADRFEDGYSLYGKHPLLVYLYLPLYAAAGLGGLIALSIAGTVGAAVGAAVLAERIRPSSGPLALWVTGVASPLFFDAFVIHAHTLGAALAVLAVLLALRFIDRPSLVTGAGVLIALLATALLRTEGLFFAVAVGSVVGVVGIARRRLPLVVLGAMAGATGPAALLLDRAWAKLVGGGPRVPLEAFPLTEVGFWRGRLASASFTTIVPGYRGSVGELLATVGAIVLLAGVVVLRRRPDDEGAVVLPLIGAALIAVRAVVAWGPVPGIVVAFVVGMVGLALADRALLSDVTTRIVLAVAGAYAVAVFIAQYDSGGHTEWGGRYFALGVPLLGAVAAASIDQVRVTWERRRWRPLQISLVTAAVALAVLAVLTLRWTHERNLGRTEAVLDAAAALPAGEGPPIVVTEDEQVPRLARERYDEVRFLRVAPPAVPDYLDELAAAGITDLVLVSVDPAETLEHLPNDWTVTGPVQPHDLQWEGGGGIITLHREPAAG